MSDNDLIKREDVVFLLDSFIAEYGKTLIAEVGDIEEPMSAEELASIVTDVVVNILATVKAIPSVSREMSAVEYMRVAHRLCHGKEVACAECPLHGKKENLGICLHMSMDMIAIELVEQWAKDHPEEFCSRGERREAE